MAVRQTFTNAKTGVLHTDAFRHIRIDNYDHKKCVKFRLDDYSSENFYNEHILNPEPYRIPSPKRFVLNAKVEDTEMPNPLYDQYLGSLSQSGKDLIGELYAYLKNETTELAEAVDV